MIQYKTPTIYYIVYFIYIILSLIFLTFLLYEYISITNQENLEIDNLTVSGEIDTNYVEIFQNTTLTNLSGININLNNINTKNYSSSSTLSSDNFYVSDIFSKNINTNFLNFKDETSKIETINYYKNEYNFIYGFLCFSYYDNKNTQYYENLPTNFFSVYLNKYPPAPSINKYNYSRFMDNDMLIKDFKIYDEIYKSNLEDDTYCSSKCQKSAAVSYMDSTVKYPYLELKNLGGFIENIQIYNTMFYNQDFESNKAGVFPTNKYLFTKDLYGMKIPTIDDINYRKRLDTRLYGQYASYNSVNFKIKLNDNIINSDLDTKLIYYDNICPRTIIYDDYYGDDKDPRTYCSKLDYLKYTYNNPDQNIILTNSTELNTDCKNKNFTKSNIKYISLMTNSWYIVPSFIISFRMNIVNNNIINYAGFNCPK